MMRSANESGMYGNAAIISALTVLSIIELPLERSLIETSWSLNLSISSGESVIVLFLGAFFFSVIRSNGKSL